MEKMEFNLLREPWIRVRTQDYTVQEVSLTDALLRAQEYADLAGEMPTQDVAMLRLLLAVLHTVFSRVDINGAPSQFKETDDALQRWGELWQLGRFPEQPIRDYLDRWQDRFWLFHPEHPFWQVPQAEIGTPFKAKKLNGEVFESGNSINLFSCCSGSEKEKLSYAQAARWLVFLNGYDDSAAKKKTETEDRPLPEMSPGWLGRLGVVYVKGDNLFETLMRNLMFLGDGGKLWNEDVPCWELDMPRCGERTEVAWPDNFAELMTMQFRRILLVRQENVVVEYTVLGGDFFKRNNALVEPMTIWGKKEETKNSSMYYYPQEHDMTKQLWREFTSLTGTRSHMPGVIWWNNCLQEAQFLEEDELLQLCAIGVEYGNMKSSMKNVYADQLAMELSLMNRLNDAWRVQIESEVENCEQAAEKIGRLDKDLKLARGIGYSKIKTVKDVQKVTEAARTQFYFDLDQPFRQWLQGIDPDRDTPEDKQTEWQETAYEIATRLGRQMVEQAGTAAFVGHRVPDKKNKEKSYLYTAPKAYNRFLIEIRKIYPKKERGGTA